MSSTLGAEPTPSHNVLSSVARSAALRGPSVTRGLLERTERWTDVQLQPHQLARLDQLLAHARSQVPFYQAHYRGAQTAPLTLEAWRELPLLTREHVLDDAASLKSLAPPRLHEPVREAHSSGSTGRHVSVTVDRTSAAVLDAISARDHAWHQRDTSLPAAAIRAIPAGSGLERTGRLSWAEQGGRVFVLDAHTPVRDQLDWLQERRPGYVATYASNAAAILAEAERAGISWPELRQLQTFGEVVTPDLRALCQRVWGVKLVDAYSSVELGFIALQCPDHPHYHVQSENVLCEVLRADGSPAQEGETGRVIVSALHAFAMPLLRYDLGDYATLGPPCDCGRGLPVLARIDGRVRNMLRLTSGDVLWPRYASNILGKELPVRQFRLVQKTYTELVLELVAEPALTSEQTARLKSLVLDTLRVNTEQPFRLSLEYRDSIPRGTGGKFEDFVSEVPG